VTADVLVVGKGPAALAAAAALAGHGLAVTVLGPPGPPRWDATYAAWLDNLRDAGFADAAARTWPKAVVHTGEVGTHVLPHPYAVLDNDRLAATLLARCAAGGVRWAAGEARSATHHPGHTAVALADGGSLDARVVVDASGHGPALVRRAAAPPQAYQTAVGFVVRGAVPAVPPGRVVLMDWRDGHLPPGEEERGAPSFLYAFALDGGRTFVEETSLAARPALAFSTLERRLRMRLAALGLDGAAVESTERVWIPMGGALPNGGQRVVGFGAAGGMVHPATGYSVARSLRAAPVLAAALAGALGRPGATPALAAREAWDALWPAGARREHALYRFGMEVLLSLGAPATRAFFDHFFRLPAPVWQGYLSGTLGGAGLAAAMARFFTRAPGELRRRMAGTMASRAGRDLASTLLGTLSRSA
jgi:lycopene beta-cyclase